MGIPISIQLEILKLIETKKLSFRQISTITGIHHQTIGKIKVRCLDIGKSYKELANLPVVELEKLLVNAPLKRKNDNIVPDWDFIRQELTKKNMTKNKLWGEYRAANRANADQCLSYSQFTRKFKQWLKENDITMMQHHEPAEKFFVDFCGSTIPYQDGAGNTLKAQVFVGILAVSGYIFAYAVPSQKESDWISCFVKAFEFLGGVTQQIVCDNLKAAVISHTKQRIQLNRAFANFAEYYDVIIFPARPRQAQDKSLAEIAVNKVQTNIHTDLRNRVFFSIHEINKEIASRLEKLNLKTTKRYQVCPYDQFLNTEKTLLKALPVQAFEIAQWHYNIRVPANYHIKYQNSHYSVPYIYAHSLVDLKVTTSCIEIYCTNTLVAMHRLSDKPSKCSKIDHMPKDHQAFIKSTPEELLAWANTQGEYVSLWAKQQLESRRDFANGVKSVQSLRNWVKSEQNYDRLESACKFALELKVLTFQQLKSIIRNQADLKQESKSEDKSVTHENIRGGQYYA